MDSLDIDVLKQRFDNVSTEGLPIPVGELCDRYEDLYTAAVSDALREATLMHQTLPHSIEPLERDMTVAGVAFTIKSAPDPTIDGELETRAEMLADMADQDHTVCVWDADDDKRSSQWGEVMTESARSGGCKGAVINGGLRDTDRVLEQEFPVFYSYRTPNGALARSRIQKYQTTIQIDDVIVKPGDIVVGDIDGVVVVPRDIAHEILVRAEEIKGSDEEVRD